MLIQQQIEQDRRAMSMALSCFEKIVEKSEITGKVDTFSAAELIDFFIRFVEEYYCNAHLLPDDQASQRKRLADLHAIDLTLEKLKQGHAKAADFIQISHKYLASLKQWLETPACLKSNAPSQDHLLLTERERLSEYGRARYLESMLSLTQRLRVGSSAYFLDTPPAERPPMIDMSAADIDQLMSHVRIGRLAMASTNGVPYIIPLPFYWNKSVLYLRLEMSGRKGELLRVNQRVCFEIDWYTENLSDYASVIVEGLLTPVIKEEECQQASEAMNSKYLHLRRDRMNAPIQELPLHRLIPEKLSGRMKSFYRLPAS